MGDPKRLLTSSEVGDELGRELLASVRNVAPPPGAKDQAWDGMAVQIAAAATIGAAAATAAATVSAEGVAQAAGGATAIGASMKPPAAALIAASAKLFTAKTVAVAMLAGSTVAAGGYWASHRAADKRNAAPSSSPAMEQPAPNLAATPSRAQQVTAPCDPAFPTIPCAPVATNEPAEDPRRPPDDRRPRNLLGLESALLTEARAQLRRGEPQAALATLERLQTRFPRGVLMQEREVLNIQVLSALGDTPAANRRARAFLDKYPTSPHAPQLRRFLGER
jgi:Tetratricopeptide repeat